MSPIKTTAKVGPDGRLHVDLLIGLESAGREVEVTVEPSCPGTDRVRSIQYPSGWRAMTQDEWVRHIRSTAASIDDPTFVRPPSLPLQDRGPIFE